MRTRGGEADQHVARGHLAAVDDVALLHYAHAETREVVIAAVIHAGHLRGLAAHQRGARKLTAAANDGHHGGGVVFVVLVCCFVFVVVLWFGFLFFDVVHAHRDEVDADGVVLVVLFRVLQFRADAVGVCFLFWLLVLFWFFV